MSDARPYQIAVPEERIAAIRRQIGEFPWDEMPVLAEGGDPWSAGASDPFMRELCRYWVRDFDWRAEEAAINRLPQLMARIGDQEIHVLHERGSGPRDAALVLTHGWPGSIVEFLGIVERLAHPERFGGAAADGIDVVVPALPGFGFSGRPAAPIGPRRIAGSWDHLLRRILGYDRYIAQGGDWGAMVSAMTGLDHALAKGGGCEAIHLNLYASAVAGGPENDEERAFLARSEPFVRDGRAYSETHRTRPQTLAFAMAANPVGAAAWIVNKFHAWSDRRGPAGGERDLRDIFGLDTLVANVMFYVATKSFATATWIYRAAQHEVMRVLPAGTRIEVPTGFASFPFELRPRPPKSLIEKTTASNASASSIAATISRPWRCPISSLPTSPALSARSAKNGLAFEPPRIRIALAALSRSRRSPCSGAGETQEGQMLQSRSTPPPAIYLPEAHGIPQGGWPVQLVGSLPPGEGGFRATKRNQPYAQVILTPGSDEWTVDASHETIEMPIDPSGSRLQTSTAIAIVDTEIKARATASPAPSRRRGRSYRAFRPVRNVASTHFGQRDHEEGTRLDLIRGPSICGLAGRRRPRLSWRPGARRGARAPAPAPNGPSPCPRERRRH